VSVASVDRVGRFDQQRRFTDLMTASRGDYVSRLFVFKGRTGFAVGFRAWWRWVKLI
jgi:hypothetical protein